MRIVLKSLKLTNFKGIKNLEIKFNDGENYIQGDNGTGKTTIFDAFLWLLFGKDSQGKKDFNAKTLNKEGAEIHRIEHNVIGEFNIYNNNNDIECITFSRTIREKWTKPKGQTEEVYSGNETLYEINNVPVKMSEYQDRVSSYIDEELFKMITSPNQFCNQK